MNQLNKHASNLRNAGLLLAVLATMLMSACAISPSDEGEYVAERAQERWNAIISGDLETAYTYYSPGFRSTTSLIDFGVSIRMRKVTYTSAEYSAHECQESRCTVTFMVGYMVFAPVPGMRKYEGQQVISDTWVRTSGEWWYLPKK